MRLDGKVALVTGAGTGIGAEVARRFVAEGARVVLVGRRWQPLEDVAAELSGRAVAVAADAAEPEGARQAVQEALDRFGGLDVVIANAGGHGGSTVGQTDDGSWAESLKVNLTSCFTTVREALPELARRRGSVVVVSSIAGLAAGPEVCGYVTTKHALIGLTRSLARDYGPDVRVNALCPGWVRTPMADHQMDVLAERYGGTRDDAYLLATKDTPLRRPAEPAEIAAICLFLAGDESSFMTGSVVVADGGATAVDLPTLAFAT